MVGKVVIASVWQAVSQSQLMIPPERFFLCLLLIDDCTAFIMGNGVAFKSSFHDSHSAFMRVSCIYSDRILVNRGKEEG